MEVLEQPHQFQVVQQLMLVEVVQDIHVENQVAELEALEAVELVVYTVLQQVVLRVHKELQEQQTLVVVAVDKEQH
jgi:hypothetical protein